jgi:hypothetical protein
MNKLRVGKIFKLASIEHLIKAIIILLVISFSNVAIADGGSTAVYKGTLSGEWGGDLMGAYVGGTFSMSISADGTVSGSFSASGSASGSKPVTISGTVSADGYISAKSSNALSEWEWIGKLSISDGRLSGSGSFKGSGIIGSWSSK